MGHDHVGGQPSQRRDEQWQFVDVLYNDIKAVLRQSTPYRSASTNCKRVPAADPEDLDAANGTSWRGTIPTGRNQNNTMPPLDQTPEYLKEMNLGSPGLRVVEVEPVYR
jgi:hypothetical protein